MYEVIGKYCDDMPLSIYSKSKTWDEAFIEYRKAREEG